jgi:hypothetical protein
MTCFFDQVLVQLAVKIIVAWAKDVLNVCSFESVLADYHLIFSLSQSLFCLSVWYYHALYIPDCFIPISDRKKSVCPSSTIYMWPPLLLPLNPKKIKDMSNTTIRANPYPTKHVLVSPLIFKSFSSLFFTLFLCFARERRICWNCFKLKLVFYYFYFFSGFSNFAC